MGREVVPGRRCIPWEQTSSEPDCRRKGVAILEEMQVVWVRPVVAEMPISTVAVEEVETADRADGLNLGRGRGNI